MAEPHPIPDWLTVGAEVIVYRQSAHGPHRANMTRTTVEKIGKRDIVLANGEKFNRTLTRHNGQWDPSTYLVHPDDERVVKARQANRISRFKAEVESAYNLWRKDVTNPDRIDELIDAVSQLKVKAP